MPPALSEPIRFVPLYMERVWGGQRLAELFGRPLPEGRPIGESWEVVDREDEQSVVAAGPLAGRTLHELWTEQREELFGARGAASAAARFPLLVKLLDARNVLSVQVHPPPDVADALGGEPKSEAWIVLDADEGAHLLAGLRTGVDRPSFERALRERGDVGALLHRLDVRRGDAFAVPAGRVHAIGGGCVIAEIQQNSDTTYRVWDFDRAGLDGRPRELHVDQALESIDFADLEPALVDGAAVTGWDHLAVRRETVDGELRPVPDGEAGVVVVLTGGLDCAGERFGPGEVFLLPASLRDRTLRGRATVAVALLPGAPATDR